MTIEDMIDNIAGGEMTKANDVFDTLLQDRMNQALDQEKIAVAGTIFNGTEDDQLEFDLDDDDLDDEDVEEHFEDEDA